MYSNYTVTMFLIKIFEICLFVHNVYLLCRHMKVTVVHHFIFLKTKMTEFRVGCFHIDFFSKSDERDIL